MTFLLAQLSAEDVGLVKLALSVMGTLFLGLIGWVAVYMRSKAEKVDKLDKDQGLLEQRLEQLEGWRDESRPRLHMVGTLEQRLKFREDEGDELCDRVTDLERRRP